jgi:hypothetical protein
MALRALLAAAGDVAEFVGGETRHRRDRHGDEVEPREAMRDRAGAGALRPAERLVERQIGP